MSSLSGGPEPDMFELPDPEFSPPQHPFLTFRAYSAGELRRLIFLGGDEYWIHGTWMISDGARMLMVRNRVFQVSELRNALAGVQFDLEIEECRVTLS